MVGFYCQFVYFGGPLHLILPASIKPSKEAAEMLRQSTFEGSRNLIFTFLSPRVKFKNPKSWFWSKATKTVVLIQKSLDDITFSVIIAV